ncbi:peptidase S8 [Aestuariibacter sp. GS-14]|uniref:S8 family peptidase n=1 Tax=Aestuariibacter sp. GS-14 TaxID=2590670 RepID=UPI00112B4E89|nr:S8 family peptidase [Aestuariibacter sp. GS-14]TPV60026.1 peptidase S8 [Aestuariibacter sp. GS-14]
MKPIYTVPFVVSGLLLTSTVIADNQAIEPTSVNKPVNVVTHQASSATANASEKQPYIIRLTEPSVAQYSGGIRGFEATMPVNATKGKLSRVNSQKREVTAYRNYLKQQQAGLLNRVASVTGNTTPLKQFQYAINGVVMNLTAAEAETIRNFSGVKAVEADKKLKLNTDTSTELTGARQVWSGAADSGLDAMGEGTVVAVFDTGINTDHPSFAATGGDGYTHTNPLGSGNYLGDCAGSFPGLCNDKLIGVYSYSLITSQYADTDVFPIGLDRNGEDYNGHGSHVASTAAGNVLNNVPVYGLAFDEEVSDGYPGEFAFSQISGMAPHANIIAFQTCLPGESDDKYTGCYYSLAISAIDDAIETGIVDVINYSISGGEAVWGDALSEAWLSANNAGIFVAHSAGNDGPAAATSDKYAPWITPVAATDHGRVVDFTKTLSGFSGGVSAPSTITGQSNTAGITATVVYAGDYTNANDPDGDPAQCLAPFPAGTFNGEIVMCDRGEIARVQKAKNVADGGAGGYILANVSADANNLVGDVYVIPGIHVSLAAGNQLRTWLASGSGHRATISTTSGTLSIDEDSLDTVASFSSRGPNTEISTLLPMVSAPGVQIYAAYADEHYGHETTSPAPADYAYLDGTSMASPHVAGAAALVRQVNPTWSADAIRSALMMTAESNLRVAGSLDDANWLDMGSGRIQVNKAVNAGLIIEETQANYEAADPDLGGEPKDLNIPALVDNNCLIECSWQRTFTATKAGSWTVAGDAMASGLEVSVSPASFTLAAGQSQTVTVTVNTWNANDGDWEFAQILLTSANSPDLHLPVAVVASNGNFPDDISQTSYRNADSLLIKDLVAIEITDFTARASGLVAATVVNESLAEDSDNDTFLDDIDDGVYLQIVEVEENTDRLVALISDSTAPDLDLFVVFDINGDESISTSEIIAASTTGSWDEYVNIAHPDAGTYYVFVQNYTGSNRATDDFVLEYAVVPAVDEGTLSVDGPTSVALREPFDMRVSWQLPDSLEGDRYFGAIVVGSDADNPANLGTIPVDLVRGINDVTMAATSSGRVGPGDVASYAVTVKRNNTNENRDYEISVTVPDGTSVVNGSVGNGGVVNGKTIAWQVTQTANGTSASYDLTSNQSDPQCTVPNVGQGTGYIDLQALGYKANFSSLDTALANYPIQFEVLNDTLNSLNVSSKGFITSTDARVSARPGINQSLTRLQNNAVTLAPFWRDWSFATTSDAGIAAASFNNGKVSVIEWRGMVSGTESADFEVILVHDAANGEPSVMFAYNNVTLHDDSTPSTIGYASESTQSGGHFGYISAADNSVQASVVNAISSGTVLCLTDNSSIQAAGDTTLSFSLRLDNNANISGAVLVALTSSVTNIPGTGSESLAANSDVQVHAAPIILINGATTASLSMTEQQATVLPVTVSDANGDSVTLSVEQLSGPAASVSVSGETITVTPASAASGNTIVLKITATDEFGYSSSAQATVTVTENQPPVLTVSAPSSVQEGSTITIRATATDPEGDTVTFTINGVPGSSFSSTAPETDSSTTVNFTVTATDGNSTVTQSVSVTVTNRPSSGGGSLGIGLLIGLALLTLQRARKRVMH